METIYKKLNIDKFGFWFICFGLITQVITYIFTEDTLLSMISGIAGVISVVLCSQRKVSFYLWGFIQLGTFSIICLNEQLYGKLFENLFYTVTMLYGIYIWTLNRDEKEIVKTRSLNSKNKTYIIIQTIGLISVLYIALTRLGDTQPLFDSISTGLAIIAQMLMILRYKENWIYWFLVDLLCIIMFIIAENYCMVMQYVFWTGNCLYGYLKWKKDVN